MQFECIQAIVERSIGVISLNRPDKKNALSIQMRREISACLTEWSENEEIRAVIIRGIGKAFSAGFDLQEFSQLDKIEDIYQSSAQYHRDVWHFSKPIIAAIDGAALGGGFDLTLLCDIRICTKAAKFGHPEIKFGANPLYTPLRWIAGTGTARYLCLSGRIIDAAEAHRLLIVSEVVESDVYERALEIAHTILEAPQGTLISTKRYMVDCTEGVFETSFVAEHDVPFETVINKIKAGL
ncbi:MAG: enoyl-CoA hydratase/isomerase family protein [Ignavibacteriales bacterium]